MTEAPRKLTVGSLFSGIGGLELGLEWTGGFETIWQCEIDPYARAVLAKHWPEVPRYEDVRHITAATVPSPDVLIGGFPCQPHSVAGKRGASLDERDLWGEFARIIGETRPRWVVAENVSGLLTSRDPVRAGDYSGAFFGRVLSDLAALGYDAEWDCISAAAVGAPHIRDRVFLLAYPNGSERRQEPKGGHDGDRHDTGWQEAASGLAARREDGRAGDVADSFGGRVQPRRDPGVVASETRPSEGDREKRRDAARHRREDVAHADRSRQLQPQGGVFQERRWTPDGRWWATEPDVGRVVDGVPARVDRLRTLGNAVVPQVAQVIGEMILAAELAP